ncbi:GNAT family N-acetyltransferase [Geomicrobium sp. JCM 19039]|uniref:GNAT family N-acetyltransferase n=1 Tax=Geomicrobium sp. JCM 19039 TaxID=1460636 RepID=UPI00045F1346|nr:GNAT family N-acetyltransferase [Geomicrobium sp. JCM 19039]GAK11938.1 ribosomal-protein-alanine acetyltransferase [Geomicrobium sp. JCM 19039]
MITLRPHQLEDAEHVSALSSHEKISGALGLSKAQTSVEGTRAFISFVNAEEAKGNMYSRAIVFENKIVGVITLKQVDLSKRSCHIGTWIGYPYWGQGINAAAKKQILQFAFDELNLQRVFAGAKAENVRSIKAQEKLPYIRTNVEHLFPEKVESMVNEYGTDCILNVIEERSFYQWLNQNR